MKTVLQRVRRAEVSVDGAVVGSVGRGVLALLGVLKGDDEGCAERLAERVAGFRIFSDDEGRMNLAAAEVGARILVVSQFTLAADGRRGRRPSFERAAPPERAEALYRCFCERLGELGLETAEGVFGAMMEIELVNDGPVTFVLEELPGRS